MTTARPTDCSASALLLILLLATAISISASEPPDELRPDFYIQLPAAQFPSGMGNAPALPIPRPPVTAHLEDSSPKASPADRTLDTTATAQLRSAFEKSYRLEQQKKYAEAIAEIEMLGNVPGREYELHLRKGWLHYQNKNHEAASREYEAAIKLEPSATEPRVGQLLPLLGAERYEDTIQASRKVLILDPVNYYATLRLAHSYRMLGNFRDAEIINRRMLALQPADVSFLSELALVYQGQKREADARAIFERVLLFDPKNALAREQLGLSPWQDTVTPLAAAIPGPEWKSGIIPSLAAINYGDGSIKDNGLSAGMYGYVSYVNLLEFAFDYTHLNYRTDNETLDQYDYTLVYSAYDVLDDYKFRGGIHLIGSSDDFGDGSYILFTGAQYFKSEQWDVALDYYYSHYDDSTFSLDMNQITPKIGIEHRLGETGPKMRLEALGYYINAGSDLLLGTRNFYSVEGRWRLDGDCWGIALYAWTGDQTFAVRRDGFLVYNLSELHKGGYGGDLIGRVDENTWFTLRGTYEFFNDFSTANGTWQWVVAGLLSRSF